jgi:hypothetical protein
MIEAVLLGRPLADFERNAAGERGGAEDERYDQSGRKMGRADFGSARLLVCAAIGKIDFIDASKLSLISTFCTGIQRGDSVSLKGYTFNSGRMHPDYAR